jgi:hypothetical protein
VHRLLSSHDNKRCFQYKEIKMKNKRAMVIPTVSVLAILLGTAAFLFLPRPIQSAQPIPVTGLVHSQWESPIQEYIRNLNAQEANTPVSVRWESPIQEYIRNLSAREANTR